MVSMPDPISGDDSVPPRRLFNPRRRRHHNENENTNTCSLCYPAYFLICLTKMKPGTRVALTWFYIIICACVTGSVVSMCLYSDSMTASPTDVRKVDTISQLFCKSVTIQSSTFISTYKFDSEPKVRQNLVDFYQREAVSLARDEHQYWGFYLLKGSIITARICATVNVYQFKGKDNLDKWINGYKTDSVRKFLIPTSVCRMGWGKSTTVNITASESDYYYFLLVNTEDFDYQGRNVEVDFYIGRKFYNIYSNSSTVICVRDVECTVPLPVRSFESVVFYVPSFMRLYDFPVDITCNPRVYMYVLIFGIFPFVFGIAVTYAILKCTKTQNNERGRSESNIFTVSDSEHLQDYDRFQVQMSPPSYADVVALTSSEAPPSYEDVVTNSDK